MEISEKHVSKTKVIVIYLIVFYTIWALFEFFAKPFIDKTFTGDIISQIIKTVIIKNLVWVFPAAILIHYYKDDVCVGLKEMYTTKIKWLEYLPVLLLFIIYPLITAYINKGSIIINEEFGVKQVITYTFVGITEEMVFRGWLLNATVGKEQQHKWRAILLTSFLFAAIHIPTWITHEQLIDNFVHLKFLFIVGLSIIFSITFLKSKNIIVPIVLHMIWDFLIDMFC